MTNLQTALEEKAAELRNEIKTLKSDITEYLESDQVYVLAYILRATTKTMAAQTQLDVIEKSLTVHKGNKFEEWLNFLYKSSVRQIVLNENNPNEVTRLKATVQAVTFILEIIEAK